MKKTVIPKVYIDAYQRNEMTIYDIATLMGKSPSTIYNALRDEGVDTGAHRKRKQERNKKLAGAYRDGKGTLKKIGAIFGVSRERVRQIVKSSI